ncbi:LacI family DNA-binding transcriptional regulator [Demequina globuliformis]|uniref:LacI family DNA-binding transcriptional regulator n=1 Tax=Demequina globuliformis TaxID=676202 RepID=UPI0007841529|nr:LacI family DNA-binding transcriptional regulator [Demequina globuliformis]
MVSVKDVAARAGVSIGTVSNVINRPDYVRADTLARVQAAISELGYVPNAAARQLRAGQSTTIAFVVLDVGNPFFTDVAEGVEDAALEAGLTVVIANSRESVNRETSHLQQFERQRVAGVLLAQTSRHQPHVAALRAHGVPVVLVDRRSSDSSVASVAVDDTTGGALAARHLLDQGCERLVFVGGPSGLTQVEDRLAGATGAVAAAPGATITHVPTQALTLDDGMRVGERVREMVRTGQCDAVFAANDLLAIGVQQALLSGPDPVSIPHDVALVGYDDISFAAAAVVPITSVRQPRAVLGSKAVELLLRESTLGPDDEREHVEFQPELVVRDSSRRATPPRA